MASIINKKKTQEEKGLKNKVGGMLLNVAGDGTERCYWSKVVKVVTFFSLKFFMTFFLFIECHFELLSIHKKITTCVRISIFHFTLNTPCRR